MVFNISRKELSIIVAALLLSMAGCVDSGYYGLSSEANIIAFDIEGQVSNEIVAGEASDTGKVFIGLPEITPLTKLKVTKATCTQLATFSTDPFAISDFSQGVVLNVTAENKAISKPWRIVISLVVGSGQIPFSDMKSWAVAKDTSGKDITYTEDKVKKNAYFPGNGGYSPWQTSAWANAFALSGINTMTTSPRPSAEAARYARIETINKSITKVVTGALFTGTFIFDLKFAPLLGSNEPRKMINLGIPFTAHPKAAEIKLRYQPGDRMIDSKNNTIAEGDAEGRPSRDSCEVYVLLHNRTATPGTYIRVGIAHWRSGETLGDMNDDDGGFVTLNIPFIYGKPDDTKLAEKPYAKIGGCRGELTFFQAPVTKESKPVTEIYADDPSLAPTHISILFSSSVYGDFFWGAVNAAGETLRGSTLDIKDFKLIY